MTVLGKYIAYRLEHLPRISITFFIVLSYIAIIALGGLVEGFINPSNKELLTRLGDAFYLAVAYFLGRESDKKKQQKKEPGDEGKN
jgi:hypothetical protein